MGWPRREPAPVGVCDFFQARPTCAATAWRHRFADLKYKDKDIAVTGWVDKVDTELFNDDEYVVQVGDRGGLVRWTVNSDNQQAGKPPVVVREVGLTRVLRSFDEGDLPSSAIVEVVHEEALSNWIREQAQGFLTG